MDDDQMILQKPLSELIADRLKRDIWDKKIKIGDRMIEAELAENFDVSRSTIREALKILEVEGLVISKARKGTYVQAFSEQDVHEIIQLRKIIEAEAFNSASEVIKKSHFQELSKIIEQMKVSADEKNWNKLFDLDMKFHGFVVRLCNNARMIQIYLSLQGQIRTFLMNLDQYYSSSQSFYEEHVQLLQALQEKDKSKLEGLVKEHIEYVEKQTLGLKRENAEEVIS